MARTHKYVLARQILASGREDPTLLYLGGKHVERRHKDDAECPDCAAWRPRADASRRSA